MSRPHLLGLAAGLVTSLIACAEEPTAGGELVHLIEGHTRHTIPDARKIDILFVIDNSVSMAEEQAALAANVEAFADVLGWDERPLDLRVAFTTTDNGNPLCPESATSPERGALVLSPCTSRLDDFVVDGPGESADVRELACSDLCTLDADALAVLPTPIGAGSADAKPRPWLERSGDRLNLPEGTSLAEAFGCFMPQGIAGCEFESPLESMHQALLRTMDQGDPAYGFLRPGASLLVVFVTDEADCSHVDAFSHIFTPEGGKVFWGDPEASQPNSALCWNAGVSCVGDPSHYDGCQAVNKDVAGNEQVADEAAVLHPLSRYVNLLEGIEATKHEVNPDARVWVSLIAGVGDQGEPFYADASETFPVFQKEFGIGPGCSASNPLEPERPVQAVPPVRLRALSEAFGPQSDFSSCESDYTPALWPIFPWWGPSLPRCFPECVADLDPETTTLEPGCIMVEESADGSLRESVRECMRDAAGYVTDPDTHDYRMPAADVHVCYAALIDDQAQTADLEDDMSPECVAAGFNLEFKIARRPGHPAEPGSSLVTSCLLSPTPSLSCPELD